MASRFYKGETAVILTAIYDAMTGQPADPDSVVVSVYDSKNGPEIENQDMVKDSTGNYHYDVDTSVFNNLGTCFAIIKATSGERCAIEKTYFTVDDIIE